MTARLYYQDSYLREFHAQVVERSEDGRRVGLDRTAFYPASGGQPFDLGELGGVAVSGVIEEDERIVHLLDAPLEGGPVAGRIDWERRFDHMQQHTGQHLLSAVLLESFGYPTVSFHLGAEAATIDLEAASLDADVLAQVEDRANRVVCENRPVQVSFEPSEDAAGLRKPSARTGPLRIVTIADLDRSACGGTHVRATGEIGPILIRRAEKIRGLTRLEFLCGFRATRRARRDFEALGDVARLFSSALDEAPAQVRARLDAWHESGKALRRMSAELARYRAGDLYTCTPPGPDGIRRHVERRAAGSLDEELRALAQGFTAQERAVFVAAISEPPALLLAASADAGIDAGRTLRETVSALGGRGGGSPGIAQGSLPDAGSLELALARLAPPPGPAS